MRGHLKRRMTLTIECDVPEGVPARELRGYIADALASWGGSGDPDEPLFAGVKARRVIVPKLADTRLVYVRRWHA